MGLCEPRVVFPKERDCATVGVKDDFMCVYILEKNIISMSSP